jgi:hypothetical protein
MIVVVYHPDGDGSDMHEAAWVDTVFAQSGQLLINLYDERLEAIGWRRYADRAWWSVGLHEPPTAEMQRVKHDQDVRTGANTVPGYPNGGMFGQRP